jgi:hypothetical protein
MIHIKHICETPAGAGERATGRSRETESLGGVDKSALSEMTPICSQVAVIAV